MDNSQKIGYNIKSIREKLNYTQEQVASILGVSREMISYYENGDRKIPLDSLNKIADFFSVDLYDLLESDDILSKINTAFAFRADEILNDDLIQIASFSKIVKNYIKMNKYK
jgi:transcriptional regulator with XRE-family HTH domain